MIIRAKAYPRVGLVGNPSDGYFGKTISFVFRNFCAEVVLYQTPELEILPSERDGSTFPSVGGLVRDVNLFGYYGGIRLLKATIKRFADYCRENRIEMDDRNFTIRYSSDIPHQVGLAGSSAIITATFRALMRFYQIGIPNPILANLVLSVEKDELGIAAGLQDRVVQVYQGLVYMDFTKAVMEKQGYGIYENLDPALLPNLYLAYRTDLSEISDVFHNNIRDRFARREPLVVNAMEYWADLATQVYDCLQNHKPGKIGKLLNANFNMRKKIYRISSENVRMVNAARAVGASAKFTGSGGAIVGTYSSQDMLAELKKKMKTIGVKVLKPSLVKNGE